LNYSLNDEKSYAYRLLVTPHYFSLYSGDGVTMGSKI